MQIQWHRRNFFSLLCLTVSASILLAVLLDHNFDSIQYRNMHKCVDKTHDVERLHLTLGFVAHVHVIFFPWPYFITYVCFCAFPPLTSVQTLARNQLLHFQWVLIRSDERFRLDYKQFRITRTWALERFGHDFCVLTEQQQWFQPPAPQPEFLYQISPRDNN